MTVPRYDPERGHMSAEDLAVEAYSALLDALDAMARGIEELAAEWRASLADPDTTRALGVEWSACLRANLPRLTAILDREVAVRGVTDKIRRGDAGKI